MQKSSRFIGLDIGGTKIEATLVEIQGKTIRCLYRERQATLRDLGYEHCIQVIRNLISNIQKEVGTQIDAIGLGLPGSVHPESMRMLRGNTHFFAQHDVLKDLGFSQPITAGNDANCFALAEVYLGVGPKHPRPIKEQIAIGIILGTGVGGGLVYNGELFVGRHGGALEIGHLPIFNSKTTNCYCPLQQGCSELELSGHGIEQQYLQKSIDYLHTDAGLKIYKEKLQKLLVTLTNTFDPDYFVLGGGLSNTPHLYDGLETYLLEKSFIPNSEPKVYKNSLGDSAGVFGAALLAYQYWQKNTQNLQISLDFSEIFL